MFGDGAKWCSKLKESLKVESHDIKINAMVLSKYHGGEELGNSCQVFVDPDTVPYNEFHQLL